MYAPTHFEESRMDVLHDLIRRRPLGTLVAMTPEGLDASHIPFEIDSSPAPYGVLRCHVACANPLWRSLSTESEVLAIFQGAESYISPAWYPAKQEHGKVVPTWNYVAVHVHGKPTVIHDHVWLRTLVEALTNRREADRADPWKVSDAPAEYIDKMLAAIVGIEIPITRISGKWKLSQNRSAADRRGVVAGLTREAAGSGQGMAQLMDRMA
ncbi:MAG: FMN-binding negative transcriptional regulator [Steroidobacter sp.]